MGAFWKQRLNTPQHLTIALERAETFSHTDYKPATIEFFSQRGFIASHKDAVVCVYCDVHLATHPSNPTRGIDAAHRMKSPACPLYVQPYDYICVADLEVGTAYKIAAAFTRSPYVLPKDDYRPALHPQYISYDQRVASFENCQIEEVTQRKEEYAKNGFLYLMSDILICYHCGGGLKCLQGKYDTVSYLHMYFYPECLHMKLTMGSGQMQKARKQYESDTFTAYGFIDYFHATKVILKDIRKRVDVKLNSLPPEQPFVNIAALSYKIQLISFTHKESTLNLTTEEETEEDEEKSKCILCVTAPRTLVILPCNHFYSCVNCFINSNTKTCSYCNGVIENVVKVAYV